MSEKDNLQNAINLLMNGKRKEAAAELLNLDSKIMDKNLRIQLIDASLSALDPTKDGGRLIELSGEGIKIAGDYGRKDLQAHFMSRRADFLMTKVAFLQYRRQNLKLAPGWIEFSTEANKQEYEKLTAQVEKLEREVNDLLAQATILAEQSGNKNVFGRVLMARGSVESSRYFHYKTECMRGNLRTKLWLKFEFLRYPFFEHLIIFTGKNAQKLRSPVDTFTENFLKAAQIFEELGDSTAGYAYHNLANDLKTAYRFREARKYLEKAKSIAVKHNDPLLKKQVEMLEKAIKAKNRDIPDYLSGETRESD